METYDEYIGQDLLCAFSFSSVSESATYMRPLYIIRSDGRMDQITNGLQAFPNYGRIFVPMHRDLKRETLLYRVVIRGKLDPANSYDRSEQYVGRCQDTLRVTPFPFDLHYPCIDAGGTFEQLSQTWSLTVPDTTLFAGAKNGILVRCGKTICGPFTFTMQGSRLILEGKSEYGNIIGKYDSLGWVSYPIDPRDGIRPVFDLIPMHYVKAPSNLSKENQIECLSRATRVARLKQIIKNSEQLKFTRNQRSSIFKVLDCWAEEHGLSESSKAGYIQLLTNIEDRAELMDELNAYICSNTELAQKVTEVVLKSNPVLVKDLLLNSSEVRDQIIDNTKEKALQKALNTETQSKVAAETRAQKAEGALKEAVERAQNAEGALQAAVERAQNAEGALQAAVERAQNAEGALQEARETKRTDDAVDLVESEMTRSMPDYLNPAKCKKALAQFASSVPKLNLTQATKSKNKASKQLNALSGSCKISDPTELINSLLILAEVAQLKGVKVPQGILGKKAAAQMASEQDPLLEAAKNKVAEEQAKLDKIVKDSQNQAAADEKHRQDMIDFLESQKKELESLEERRKTMETEMLDVIGGYQQQAEKFADNLFGRDLAERVTQKIKEYDSEALLLGAIPQNKDAVVPPALLPDEVPSKAGAEAFAPTSLPCDLKLAEYASSATRKELGEGIIRRVSEFMRAAGREMDDVDILNYLICFTQGFITTFAGRPGSGKTSLCNLMAKALGLAPDGANSRFVDVPVSRGWASYKDLIGYYNPLSGRMVKSDAGIYDALMKAGQEMDGVPHAPMIILLDEANLSPIEHYWSVFLKNSDMDNVRTRKFSLGGQVDCFIPEHLRFFATVNFDHTTEELSPRFLDRSWVILLDEQDSEDYCEPIEVSNAETAISYNELKAAFGEDPSLPLSGQIEGVWRRINKTLKDSGIPVMPRSSRMVLNYIKVASHYLGEADALVTLDNALAQKVLPTLSGNGDKFSSCLKELEDICLNLTKSKRILERMRDVGERNLGIYNFFAQ